MSSVSSTTSSSSTLAILAAAKPQSASDAVKSSLTKDVADELGKYGMGGLASSTAITGFVSKLGSDVMSAIQSSNGSGASDAVSKAVSGDLDDALRSMGLGGYASSSAMASFAAQLGKDALDAAQSADAANAAYAAAASQPSTATAATTPTTAGTATSSAPAASGVASTPAASSAGTSAATSAAIVKSLTASVDAALKGLGYGSYANSAPITDLIAKMGKDVGAILQSATSGNAASAVNAALTKDVGEALNSMGYGRYASSSAVTSFVAQMGKDVLAAAKAAGGASASGSTAASGNAGTSTGSTAQSTQAGASKAGTAQSAPAQAAASQAAAKSTPSKSDATSDLSPKPVLSTLAAVAKELKDDAAKTFANLTKGVEGHVSKKVGDIGKGEAATAATQADAAAKPNDTAADTKPLQDLSAAVRSTGDAAELLEKGQKAYKAVLAELQASKAEAASATPAKSSSVNDNVVSSRHPLVLAYGEHAEAA